MLASLSARATGPGDVANAVLRFRDTFNQGGMQAVYPGYAAGDITIADEFAPHRWSGPNAARAWTADYDKHAATTGVTDGSIKYGAASRVEVEGDVAYVVLPSTYCYKEHGKAMAEEGQMTLVLHAERGAWKIRSWTWAGAKPRAA